jgi:hypothetical protein
MVACTNCLKAFLKTSLLQDVGIYIKLPLYIVAMYIKALVI